MSTQYLLWSVLNCCIYGLSENCHSTTWRGSRGKYWGGQCPLKPRRRVASANNGRIDLVHRVGCSMGRAQNAPFYTKMLMLRVRRTVFHVRWLINLTAISLWPKYWGTKSRFVSQRLSARHRSLHLLTELHCSFGENAQTNIIHSASCSKSVVYTYAQCLSVTLPLCRPHDYWCKCRAYWTASLRNVRRFSVHWHTGRQTDRQTGHQNITCLWRNLMYSSISNHTNVACVTEVWLWQHWLRSDWMCIIWIFWIIDVVLK